MEVVLAGVDDGEIGVGGDGPEEGGRVLEGVVVDRQNERRGGQSAEIHLPLSCELVGSELQHPEIAAVSELWRNFTGQVIVGQTDELHGGALAESLGDRSREVVVRQDEVTEGGAVSERLRDGAMELGAVDDDGGEVLQLAELRRNDPCQLRICIQYQRLQILAVAQ